MSFQEYLQEALGDSDIDTNLTVPSGNNFNVYNISDPEAQEMLDNMTQLTDLWLSSKLMGRWGDPRTMDWIDGENKSRLLVIEPLGKTINVNRVGESIGSRLIDRPKGTPFIIDPKYYTVQDGE